jgi:DNA (cytosine-5)-methyltransferase 1
MDKASGIAMSASETLANAASGAMRNDGKNERPADRKINPLADTGIFAVMADTESAECTGSSNTREWITGFTNSDWWAVEPDVGRVANGIPFRVDRLKGLGNAVVPRQAYPIFKVIAEIERMEEKEA